MLGVAAMTGRAWRAVAAVVLTIAFVAGCSGSGSNDASNRPKATPSFQGTAVGKPLGTLSKYANAVDAAHAAGLEVWIEADLVSRWLEGPKSLATGVRRAGELAARPGVVGVKIADELGEDDGLDSREEVLAFLKDASRALRAVLPSGSLILIDVVVPELGCVRGEPIVADLTKACITRVREQWPGAALPVVDAVVRSGFVDAVNVSSGLLTQKQYTTWGITPEIAQRAAWRQIVRMRWEDHVQIRARKALAYPDPYRTAGQAAAAMPTFVDLPVEAGAQGVDVWTWRQKYHGHIVGLMDPGLRSNALWHQLRARRDRGVKLLTHFTPSQVQESLVKDLRVIASVFSGVYVASGTG
jgi:hypothetical protein